MGSGMTTEQAQHIEALEQRLAAAKADLKRVYHVNTQDARGNARPERTWRQLLPVVRIAQARASNAGRWNDQYQLPID
jgi:hypothetical protein